MIRKLLRKIIEWALDKKPRRIVIDHSDEK